VWSRRTLALLLALVVVPFLSFSKTVPHGHALRGRKKPSKKKRSVANSARSKRLRRAFVASADLKPMARQLLQDRSKPAYAAVEKFAKHHAGREEGALAYYVIGYAHALDHQDDKAIRYFKLARPYTSELGDYIDLGLARSYSAENRPQDVVATLDGFTQRHPDSVYHRDAALLLASALLDSGSPRRAVEVLEPFRKPLKADSELLAGRALEQAGENDQAIEAFRHIYYELPASPQSDEAGAELPKLTVAPYASQELRLERARRLVTGHRYWQAISEYRELIAEAGVSNEPSLHVELAHALFKNNQLPEAAQELQLVTGAPEDADAERLWLSEEIARSKSDDPTQMQSLEELRQKHPHSSWFEQALLSTANVYLLRNDLENATKYYDELATSFPDSKWGVTAHWRAGWFTYRQGKYDDAKRYFTTQIERYPDSAEVPNAIYWLGRLAENDQKPDVARAYYEKLSTRFPHYYHAELARERLAHLGEGDPATVEILNKISPAPHAPQLEIEVGDPVNVHLLRAHLLENGALFDLALRELRSESDAAWFPMEEMRLFYDESENAQAIEALKKAIPLYSAMKLDSVPLSIWEGLFPRPYWNDLQSNAQQNGLDPYLVASLIRQESEFNPVAISHAQAYGLMQLLPSVGKTLAKQVHLRHFITNNLLDPTINMKLGARYFKQLLDENGGQVEYALAAYNAGQNRVAEWRSGGNFKDVPEFVESIPFTETREYVQAIMRNCAIYKELYGSR